MGKQSDKEDLLKAVADVLDEALAEYEKLAKWEEMQMAEDPTRPVMMPSQAKEESHDEDEESHDDDDEKLDDKEDDKKEDLDKEDEDEKDEKNKEEDEDEMDDDTLKSRYAEMCAKMESRGLMKKSEKTKEVKKSEISSVEDKTEVLRKSVDERFDSLTKAIAEISATVNKIASSPARKGVAGYQPLRKSEETNEQPLNKAEVISKLLDLKKSGKYVDTALINRIETGRASETDAQFVKQLLG